MKRLSKLLTEEIMEEQDRPNPDLAEKQQRLLRILAAEQEESAPTDSVHLTPSEIESLRRDKAESKAMIRELLRRTEPKTGSDEM